MLASDQLNAVCVHIQELQVHRKHAIKLENKCMNSIVAMAARYCGYDANADESTREKLFARAKRIVSRGLKGKPQDEADLDIAKEIQGELTMVALMLPPLVSHRAKIESEMDALAEELPGGELIATTPGFSRHGLAVIVGEAGNLLNYPKKGHLWRRLGLGLMPGKEQYAFSTWRMRGGLSNEEWETAGYSPQRLAQIYGVVTEQLIKHKAKSRYGEVYARRRALTKITHPEWYIDKNGVEKINKETGEASSAHAAKDAARVMIKALIRDLRSEWRRAIRRVAERPIHALPAAPITGEGQSHAVREDQSRLADARSPMPEGHAKNVHEDPNAIADGHPIPGSSPGTSGEGQRTLVREDQPGVAFPARGYKIPTSMVKASAVMAERPNGLLPSP